MSITPNEVNLATVIFNNAPALISAVKDAFKRSNPGAPLPTDEQILAELKSWAVGTIAIDEQIKAERQAGSTGE